MIEWMNLPQYLLAAQNIELYKQISQTLQTSCLARLNGIIYSFHAIFSILIKLSKEWGGGGGYKNSSMLQRMLSALH